MTPQELKNSILQLAIQGKLVPQRPEEGTAEELYAQIQAEKQQLIKMGKIKKDKRLDLSEPTDDDIPFDIPESWKWVRFGSILNRLTDGTHATPKYTTSGVKFVSVKDMSNGALSLDNTKFISQEEHKELFSRCNPEKGDMLLSKVGTTGVPAIIDTDEQFSLFVSVALLKYSHVCIDEHFLYNLILSPLVQEQAKENTRGVGNKNWVLDAIANTMVVLPPLAEQKRIVAKIEELLPLIDRYEEAWTKLEEFNKRFPVDMQKSLLQMAIQGRLVDQRPEEGTGEELYAQIQAEKQSLIKAGKIKKDKPLPEITDDEKPFDIPDSWKWVRWGEIVNIVSARRVHQSDWKSGGIPFYRAREIAKLAENGCVENELFISQDLFDEFSKSGVPQAGDLMVTAVGTLGKTYIVKPEDHFYYKDASVICFENFADMLPEYLKYIMQSEMMKNQIKSNSDGTTVATLTMVRTVEYVLPLPPLAEQKRIVAKLEELLPLCERLK